MSIQDWWYDGLLKVGGATVGGISIRMSCFDRINSENAAIKRPVQ